MLKLFCFHMNRGKFLMVILNKQVCPFDEIYFLYQKKLKNKKRNKLLLKAFCASKIFSNILKNYNANIS